MLSVEDASTQILAEVKVLAPETLAIGRAVGRVAAVDVVATVTMPPWDNASMDGYALQSADVAPLLEGKRATLRVVATIAAGQEAGRELVRGEAARIMTGAPVPKGADSVVRREDTDDGAETVEVRSARDLWKNIRLSGEDYRRGDTLLKRGTEIRAAHVGVLASSGFADASVYRAPRVAIISSGDELVGLERFAEVRAARKIVSSNSYSLTALTSKTGAEPLDLGIAADTPQALREKLESARGCDLIITSAGVSVGDLDHARDVFAALGGVQKFWKVRMRPGAPLAFGLLGGVPWLGMSGNPVSAMVSFELFARPAIRKMMGFADVFRRTIEVVLDQDVRIAARLTHFLRAQVSVNADGSFCAHLAGNQSSGALTSMARANALLIVPESTTVALKGSVLRALPLDDSLAYGRKLAL